MATKHIFLLHTPLRVWSYKRSFLNQNFNRIGEHHFSEHTFFWYGDQRIHGACVVRPARLAGQTRCARPARLARATRRGRLRRPVSVMCKSQVTVSPLISVSGVELVRRRNLLRQCFVLEGVWRPCLFCCAPCHSCNINQLRTPVFK